MKCHIVAECNHKYSWACTLHLAKMIHLLKYTIVKSYNVNIRFERNIADIYGRKCYFVLYISNAKTCIWIQ